MRLVPVAETRPEPVRVMEPVLAFESMLNPDQILATA